MIFPLAVGCLINGTAVYQLFGVLIFVRFVYKLKLLRKHVKVFYKIVFSEYFTTVNYSIKF